MINYIVQVLLFQVLFLAVYDLFLNKETFFKWNRLYLIATPVLSLLIPLMKFEAFKNSVSQDYIIWLPEVVLNPQVVIEQTTNSIETLNYLSILFYVGVAIFSILFLFKLSKIIHVISSNEVIKKEKYKLVLLNGKASAFSFFNYIFIDEKLSEKKELQIIQHELVHCKQYHTADLIFFEIFKIVMWFNPMVYIYQNRITLLHEYISDAEVVRETDKTSYFNKLLSETFKVENISFVNQFYKKSLIKKRIAMITKNKSEKMKQLKYLVLIPLLGTMLLYSSCEPNIIEPNEINEAKLEIQTLYTFVDGKLTSEKLSKETYLDLYTSIEEDQIKLEAKLVKVDVLLPEEKIEYDKILKMTKKEMSLYQLKEGRKIVFFNYKQVNRPTLDQEYYKGKEDVPYAIIEEPPVFPGCEGVNQELKKCFNKELQKFVAINFNADLAQSLDLEPGGNKIYSQFKILKSGEIEIVGVRAPHPDLEKEARRVIGLLPTIKPGKFDGKEVNVIYMLPISFNVVGDVDSAK